MNEIEEPQQTRYGEGDATFQAAGGERGIRKLVSCFYDNMDTIAEAKIIRAMHPEDMASLPRQVSALFMWLDRRPQTVQ